MAIANIPGKESPKKSRAASQLRCTAEKVTITAAGEKRATCNAFIKATSAFCSSCGNPNPAFTTGGDRETDTVSTGEHGAGDSQRSADAEQSTAGLDVPECVDQGAAEEAGKAGVAARLGKEMGRFLFGKAIDGHSGS